MLILRYMNYIIGLGNIGDRYKFTRHNTGFIITDSLREMWGMESWRTKTGINISVSEGEVEGELVSLIKPVGFMNNSGISVSKLKKIGLKPSKCVLIHDEIDLPLGFIKINYGRGPGGHRGVSSVIGVLRTKNFLRIRVGISPVSESGKIKKTIGEDSVHRFVLGKFSEREIREIGRASVRIKKYLEIFLKEGMEKAISRCEG